MQVHTIVDQLLFSTARITDESYNGSGSGTGFLLSKAQPEGAAAVLLVTNKHVVAGADRITMHLIAAESATSPALGSGLTVTCSARDFFGHPDVDIDVAMIGIGGGALQHLSEGGTPAFFKAVSFSMCATRTVLEDYEPIEPVTFIGYPNGFYDSTSLLPIVRQGFAATAMNVDYEDRPVFLIDASVFPGSSGSPVFLVPRPSAPDRHGNTTIDGPAKPPILLGIVAAVHQRRVPVILASADPGAPVVNELIDRGIVYKASAIREPAEKVIASDC